MIERLFDLIRSQIPEGSGVLKYEYMGERWQAYRLSFDAPRFSIKRAFTCIELELVRDNGLEILAGEFVRDVFQQLAANMSSQ